MNSRYIWYLRFVKTAIHRVVLLIALTLSFTLTVRGVTVVQGASLQQLTDTARSAMEKGDFQAAQSSYEQIVKRNPKLAEAFSNLGVALYMQGRYDEAISRFLKALELNPALTNARVVLALSYFNINKVERAVPLLEKSHASAKTDLVVIKHLGVAYLKVKEYEKALALLNTWLELEPESPDALFYKGQTSLLMAISSYERLSAVAPDSFRMYQLRAELFRQQGHIEPAIGEYKKAIERGSKIPGLHYALGEIFWENKRLDEALLEFHNEVALSPNDPMTNFRIGDIYLQQRRLTEGQKFLSRAVALQPDLVDAVFQMGQLYRLQNNFPEALKRFKQVVELDPEREDAHYALFDLHRAAGDMELARKELEIFQALKQKNAGKTAASGGMDSQP